LQGRGFLGEQKCVCRAPGITAELMCLARTPDILYFTFMISSSRPLVFLAPEEVRLFLATWATGLIFFLVILS
jgi:hypothetical protein